VFNFDKPETKDFTETVRLLASLSSFVIVDITNPRSAPLELQAVVPDYMIPFVTVLIAAVNELVQGLDVLIKRAQACSAELAARKAERIRVTRMQDLLGAAGS
jgi:hypothetical protein